MDIIAIVAIALVASALCILLRQYRPEFALLVSLGAGVIIFTILLGLLNPIFSQIDAIVASSNIPSEYIEILLKSLGICFITQIACDSCKDAGESAIASKVEIAGKIAVLLISLPLFEQILSIAKTLFAS